jgi:type I restriction enzyme M protein
LVKEKNDMAIMNNTIEKKLWDSADSLRTNSKLKSTEYATPVLGIIFLRFADYRFNLAQLKIDKELENSRRKPSKIDYQKQGVLYLPSSARYNYLLNLPESEDIQLAVTQAMKNIEDENPSLKDVLPKQYRRVPKDVLIALLKTFYEIEMREDNGDTFGAILSTFLESSHFLRDKKAESSLLQLLWFD